MPRINVMLAFLLMLSASVCARSENGVVADAATRKALPNASVFDRDGRFVGTTNSRGRLPYLSPGDCPATVRYLGYEEATVEKADIDTVFLRENVTELPEVVVETQRGKALHMLAYVREYSTLSTFADTVFLFREKMVDYMLPAGGKSRFKGWRRPRVLASRSYYRFTDDKGLDSVSDRCGNYFSWADWIGVVPAAEMPASLKVSEVAADTVKGKYEAAEVWSRKDSRVAIDVNVLADTAARRWAGGLVGFFHKETEFDRIQLRFNYENVAGDSVFPVDLSGYSFNVESDGRGHGMFMFNRPDESYFVSTYGEVYIIDKEYIDIKEAKKWERRQSEPGAAVIFEPPEAPPLQSPVRSLVNRVENMDHQQVRLALAPDRRLVGRGVEKLDFVRGAFKRLRGMLGIDNLRAKRQWNNCWKERRREMVERNRQRDFDGSGKGQRRE